MASKKHLKWLLWWRFCTKKRPEGSRLTCSLPAMDVDNAGFLGILKDQVTVASCWDSLCCGLMLVLFVLIAAYRNSSLLSTQVSQQPLYLRLCSSAPRSSSFTMGRCCQYLVCAKKKKSGNWIRLTILKIRYSFLCLVMRCFCPMSCLILPLSASGVSRKNEAGVADADTYLKFWFPIIPDEQDDQESAKRIDVNVCACSIPRREWDQ